MLEDFKCDGVYIEKDLIKALWKDVCHLLVYLKDWGLSQHRLLLLSLDESQHCETKFLSGKS